MPELRHLPLAGVARAELILGGQKSGKSRRAEDLAQAWLARSPTHRARLLAPAQAPDAAMRARRERPQRDRAERVPGRGTLEVAEPLGEAVRAHSRPDTLLVVDCLTLWLTQLRMPHAPAAGAGPGHGWGQPDDPRFMPNEPPALDDAHHIALFLGAIETAPGPLVLVGNEIGLGVIPLGREVRAFVDALGRLNQDVARRCTRVTLMAAGLPLTLKDDPHA